jgi:lipoprotein-releasing system ATP-binding protein
MKEALTAKNINKYFHDPLPYHVLKNISLTVNKGEFVALVGKSGCGKSSLLYVLSTLDKDYEGSIEINHSTVTGLSENELADFRKKNIGFIFQFHYLLQEFTALQNVMIPALKLKRYDVKTIKHNAMEKLRQMEMENFASKLAGNLSGGQQQRVAIARALINDPDIIMADEPTGNLDSVNSAIIFEIFSELVKQGNTIIAVTHDHDFADKCNRAIEMVDGQVNR